MSNKPFHYQDPFPLSKDQTEYYLLTRDHVSVSEFEGQEILKVDPQALTLLAQHAFHDASFMLRPAHQQQVADILSDPEASENDKYVALQFLRNSDIAAKGILPTCQDTGTAIIVGKKGQRVWTGGGDEAALFAGDLFRMYSRYAEARRWRVEIMSASEGEHGGYKEIIAKISGDGVYGRLKFESGGHRVQRVPATESQGRIHTSACTVAVMPELPDAELPDINPADLRIDTFRSSGAGGQHVNTTDSAIRITHLPTGIVVECQDERSQHKNKAKALSVLGARIHAAEMAKRQQAEASTRRNLLGSGDRSDRNRTYNFPQGRVTDHRINLTLYRLDEVMEGKLDMLIEPIIQEHQADQLAALSEQE